MKNEIKFDFTNLTDEAVGIQGVSDSAVSSLETKVLETEKLLSEKRKEGLYPYRDLPYKDIKDITGYAVKVSDRFDSFVNVGIGGSALGAQALFMALRHPFHNLLDKKESGGMKMFFTDNIDPDQLKGVFDILEPKRTLFNIITKSGSTAETMGAFLLARDFLEKSLGSSWKDNIVVTTDAAKGDLRKIADEYDIPSFIVPDGVGGRFSALTPVGLLPAACAGIDIQELLDGAGAMDSRLKKCDPMENPSNLYSIYQYLHDVKLGHKISVMMPYSSGLYGLADWFRQLWAESLGKKFALDGSVVHTGPTPVKALGATDQHSQVQLYVEGPFDKVFTILGVDSFKYKLEMRNSFSGYSALDYLDGRTMAELIEAERLGTVYALTKNERPNMTISFPEVSPHTIGQFIYALEVSTVFSGGLYNIDPLDQPGVEGGKIAAFALMGRPGYEKGASEIKSSLKSSGKYVK